MKRFAVSFVLALTLTLFTPLGRADIARPIPSPSASESLTAARLIRSEWPAVVGSGILIAVAATGALIGIVLIRRRNGHY